MASRRMFPITFLGMEVTQESIVPWSILLALLEDGCDVCLFPVIRDLLQSPGIFKEMLARPLSTPGCILSGPVDLHMPNWLKCSLIPAQKLFPSS